MKRPAARCRPTAAAPKISPRAALDAAIHERQQYWRQELSEPRPRWSRLLTIHLQLSELEYLRRALEKSA